MIYNVLYKKLIIINLNEEKNLLPELITLQISQKILDLNAITT